MPAPPPLFRLREALGFGQRLLGLMGRRAPAATCALFIARCTSVHTCFMRRALDIVYLDAQGRITDLRPALAPWRCSRGAGASAHVLEMRAGAIAGQGLAPGMALRPWPLQGAGRPLRARFIAPDLASPCPEPHPADLPMRPSPLPPPHGSRQRGSAMIEFTVVGPLITLLGLALLQYGLLFFSRNQINHASFMAARAGTVAHARLDDIRQAYLRAMVPLYGGGTDSAELAQAKARAVADLQGNLRIDLVNPTRESFDDWSEPHLEQKYGARAIPNAGQAWRGTEIGSRSGQSVQDANLIKIRVTHGYELKIPLVRGIYRHYLGWLDDGSDPFHTELIARGRLPVVTQATLHMQSDAIESDATVSLASAGNGGHPQDWGGSGNGGVGDGGGGGDGGKKPPPDCITFGCTVMDQPETGTDEGGDEEGSECV